MLHLRGAVARVTFAVFAGFLLLGTHTVHSANAPVTVAASPTQPTHVAVLHRSGQSFVTWRERDDLRYERYRVYRLNRPITAANLSQAAMLYEVAEGSGRFFADRYNRDFSGNWQTRYLQRFVVDRGGPALPDRAGLLAWTLAPGDFGGRREGRGFYAVTTVTAEGVENRGGLTNRNTAGPIGERVAAPAPVEVRNSDSGRVHLYIQYMDLRNWNPTFHAPNPSNSYYGLRRRAYGVPGALQYAYTYVVAEPQPKNCPGGRVPAKLPVYYALHGWSANTYGPNLNPSPYFCAIEIRPLDISETWWFGFAKHHDYRVNSTVEAGDTIVNYTEQRVLRMLFDLFRDPNLGRKADPERVYVYGQSMGGSGTFGFALRYPKIFAAAYASEGMTNYRTDGDGGGSDWRDDVIRKWGTPALNLPIENGGPGAWANALKRYNGTGAWDWQDHQRQVVERTGDEIVPLGMAHGTKDMTIEWPTQGKPAYEPFHDSRRAWGGRTIDAEHAWLGFAGLPPSLAPDSSLAPFHGWTVVLHESVPGLSNAQGDSPLPPKGVGGYNQSIEWSASWDPWDGAPLDTASTWRMSFRVTEGGPRTVDITPRRLQSFRAVARRQYRWENRRVSDNALVDSGVVTADAEGLLLVPAFEVTRGGNRLAITAR